MAEGFHHLYRSVEDLADAELRRELAIRADTAHASLSNELVARRYIDSALAAEREDEAFWALRAVYSPAWVPALALLHELRSPFHEGSVVRFRQLFRGIPVKGARAMVELSHDQSLAHLNLAVANEGQLREASALPPRVTPEQASELANTIGGGNGRQHGGALPDLVFVHIHERGFVLCWRVANVDVIRFPEAMEDVGGWESPLNRPARSDVYVDAISGSLVLQLSRSRAVAAPFDLPIACTGDSEDQFDCCFDGSQDGQSFQMSDPFRHTKTYDFGLQPYSLLSPPPALGPLVSNPTPAWAASNRAAVTAIVNAQVVHDFLESLFHRQSIDGQQMSLVSVVNCARDNGDTNYPAAYWIEDRMVYGQVPHNGRLISMARHLDVVAHELCHGLTEHTANLRYQDESGALNESISDILGIIIANRTSKGDDTSSWSWEIGAGLGNGGGPLRNLADPGLGQPAQPQHMNDYMFMSQDNGGVHYNSGIHNHAAYLVLTATMPDGSPVLAPDEVARMYYFILLQLTDNAIFADARATLVNSVSTRYQVDPYISDRIAAVEQAYYDVGIY